LISFYLDLDLFYSNIISF